MDPATIWAAIKASKAARLGLMVLLVIVLCGGTYWKGRSDGFKLSEAEVAAERFEWQTKVGDLSLKHNIKVANLRNDFLNEKKALEDQINKLDKKPRVITKYIPVKVDATIPKGLVDLHNTTAAGLPLTRSKDATLMTDKKLSDLGRVVGMNYGQCNVEKAQLEKLQALVKDFQDRQKELVE